MRVISPAVVACDLAMVAPALAQAAKQVTFYKNPQCGCCEEYMTNLRENGFEVKIITTHDLPLIKKEHAVPSDLEGCHTTLVDGYLVEGYVPLKTLNKLLAERPAIKGISLPGMPMGSPGVSGRKMEPFTMFEIVGDDAPEVYAVE